jgi:hypothetical protein
MFVATALVNKRRVEICSGDDFINTMEDAEREMALHPEYKNVAVGETHALAIYVGKAWKPTKPVKKSFMGYSGDYDSQGNRLRDPGFTV